MREVSLTCFLFVGCWGIQFTDTVEMNAWAGSPPSSKSTRAAGDAERGRAVFNGKGVCHYCHGIDGNKNLRPQLAADTATLISQLNPPPVDLRNPEALHLKSDKQRARAIREGHPGRHVPGYHHDQSGTHRYLGLPCGTSTRGLAKETMRMCQVKIIVR
jgi:hypothetical protein